MAVTRWSSEKDVANWEKHVLSYTIRNEEPWLISARNAEPRERKRHMNADMLGEQDELRDYYDFTDGVRGKHYRGRPHTVVGYGIDAEIAAHFPTAEDVNNALRLLIDEGRAPIPK